VGPTLIFGGKKQTIGDESPKVSKLLETAIIFHFFLGKKTGNWQNATQRWNDPTFLK
jgi:hypothetical protein